MYHASIKLVLCVLALPHSFGSGPTAPVQGFYPGAFVGEGTLAEFNTKTGISHAIFHAFYGFPISDVQSVWSFVRSVIQQGAIPLLTLELGSSGFACYNTSDVQHLVQTLNNFGTPILLRWLHEMNAPWNPWGQQPTVFIEKWIELANLLHFYAPNVALVWSPNNNIGYPWSTSVASGTADFTAMDTNGDGVLNSEDDPFLPFFPGVSYVDWVGTSVYHRGEMNGVSAVNVLPDSGAFSTAFQSLYEFVDENAHGKPLMLAETGALYNVDWAEGGTASEYEIKAAWMQQLYPSMSYTYPSLKAILWFNTLKIGDNLNGLIDWTVTSNSSVSALYNQLVHAAGGASTTSVVDLIYYVGAPSVVYAGHEANVTVYYRVQSAQQEELWVFLYRSSDWKLFGQSSVSVTLTQSNNRTLAIKVDPDAPLAAGYTFVAHLVHAGHSSANETASGISTGVTVASWTTMGSASLLRGASLTISKPEARQ